VITYTIVWKPKAETTLAEIWTASSDRNAITKAVDRLEQNLARHPLSMGSPRNASVNRFAVDGPVGIDYEAIEDDKRVVVLKVWSVL
jgi:plasmid stabilization system protein ParE